jgi:hypothetical protein
VADFETFDLGLLALQHRLTLPMAHLAYKTYGRLAPETREPGAGQNATGLPEPPMRAGK